MNLQYQPFNQGLSRSITRYATNLNNHENSRTCSAEPPRARPIRHGTPSSQCPPLPSPSRGHELHSAQHLHAGRSARASTVSAQPDPRHEPPLLQALSGGRGGEHAPSSGATVPAGLFTLYASPPSSMQGGGYPRSGRDTCGRSASRWLG